MDFRADLAQMMDEFAGNIDYDELMAFSEVLREEGNLIPLLYRYTPADYYNIRNLEKGELFLSKAGQMNDIFEGLSGYADADTIENIDRISDIAYIKSFSENENDPHMWGIYATEYSGMCVQYDLRRMMGKEDYYSYLFPVHYGPERYIKGLLDKYTAEDFHAYRNGNDEGKAKHAEYLFNVTSAFLSKAECWKQEKEWRLVVPYVRMHFEEDFWCRYKDDDDDVNYTIKSELIKFPYATRIYIGPRMERIKREHLIEIGEKKGIEVYETRIASGKYALESRKVGTEQWHD